MSGPDLRALELLTGGRAPDALDREARVRWIGEAAEALLAGNMPSPEARLFLAGGILSWLDGHGELLRDCWRVTKAKSHRTPAAIWRALPAHQDERQPPEGRGTMASPTSPTRIE